MAKIIFITGPAGAGKTTIGRRLAEQFPKSVHIKVDELRESIVNGNPTPGPWSEEWTKKFQLGRATAIYMTKLYVANGFDVVVDEVCVPEFFADQYAELFAIESIYKVMLIPSQNVVAERLLQRGDPDAHVKFLIDHGNPWLYGYLEPMPKAGWIVIDSSNLTIEQTTEEVWQRINL